MQKTMISGLLNSLKKQEVCDKRVKGRKRNQCVCMEDAAGEARVAITRAPRKMRAV
jgi:hypothetical protein